MEIRQETLGEESLKAHQARDALIIVTMHQKRYPAMEALAKEAFEINRRVRGEEHPATLRTGTHLAVSHGAQGRLDEAERLLKENLIESSAGP